MKAPRKHLFYLVFMTLFACTICAISAYAEEVVVYTALDQVFSEPVLQEFEKRSNIKVKAVYDIEAVKTTGLVNRLIAEKQNPRCDVFWNSEIIQTILLKRKGALASYFSPSARDIPDSFRDKQGYWTGFAARARVLVVNTDLVTRENPPSSIHDLTDTNRRGKAAMANPLFGTTATHIAALYTAWGREKTRKFLEQILTNKTRIVDGNSVVRDITAAGGVLFGVTDTDDVNVGVESGMPIKAVFPDQQGEGTLLIPNTVALVKGAPHSEAGKKLIDFLLSKEVEAQLARSASAQIPVRPEVKVPEHPFAGQDIVFMQVDYEKIADVMGEVNRTLQELFMR